MSDPRYPIGKFQRRDDVRVTPVGVSLTLLDTVLAMYAWHSRHHVAHITSLRERMGW